MLPQTSFKDIQNEIDLDPDAEEKYINSTAFSPQAVSMDTTFSDGSIKITPEIAASAKIAVESRIEANKDYTKQRVEKINNNIKQYLSDESVATDGKSLAKVFFPETFNAVEDWSDDLYLMFSDMISELEVNDVGDNVEQFLAKSLEVTEVDDEKKLGFLRSLLNMVIPGGVSETSNYYFKKNEVIKEFLQRGLLKSKFTENVEKLLRTGINSGMFVIKDNWGTTGEYKLCKSEEGSKYDYILDEEDVYKFTPVDPRLLIFSKSGAEWTIEKINTTFHSLLETVLDGEGKPKEGAKYDVAMLKKVADNLKLTGTSEAKAKDHTVAGEEQDYDDDSISDLWDIDGNITIYEAHCIPLLIKKDKAKKVYKYMINLINLSESEEDPDLIAIGIQKTPYIAGNPYIIENFVEKDGDVAGIGLPELVLPLQTMLNNFAGHSVDILNIALWGIMVIDPDVFKDTANLKQITPRKIFQLKDMKGRRIEDVVQWMHPRLDTLSSMGEMFALFQQALKRTTRKGPTGEKVAPNPSATEFDTMVDELNKSVNKIGLRVNNLMAKMIERMYIYNIINMKENIKLKVQAYRIKDKSKAPALLDQINAGNFDDVEGQYNMLNKGIELSPTELFIDGIDFKLNAADTFNKKAVEKQQAMQVSNMLLSNGAVIDPNTGQPHIMDDETGAKVYISEYKLYKKLLNYFDYDDMFDRVTVDNQNSVEAANGEGGVVTPPTAPSSPPLTASPQTGDVLQQSNTLSPGVNV